MLWTMSVVLVILWLLGFVSGYTVSLFIHILLFFAIIAMLIQIEDDCSDYGSAHTRKRCLKRPLVSVESRKGIVQLSGFVNSQAAVDKAGQIPRGVKGVNAVRNDLVVK
jgi:hypothetical protein